MENVAILGGGSWGTALAISLAKKKIAVDLWCRNTAQAEEMEKSRVNSKYLPNAELPEGVHVTADLKDAVSGKSMVVLAVTSQSVRILSRGWLKTRSWLMWLKDWNWVQICA